jgi:hypothetical protein
VMGIEGSLLAQVGRSDGVHPPLERGICSAATLTLE